MPFKKVFFLTLLACSTLLNARISNTETANKFSLSNKTIKILRARIKTTKQPYILMSKTNLPEVKQLGMNGVPVLDQGELNAESAFASTAAITAILGSRDELSPLCLIQLGHHMQPLKNGFTSLQQVLSRLENYGFILKNRQKNAGCDNPDQVTIDFQTYHKFSRSLAKKNIFWWPILDLYKAITEHINTENTLLEIQQSLNQGHRITVSFLVQNYEDNPLGTVGTHIANNDTWLMTAKIKRELHSNPNLYIHSMIITGYDNTALTQDDEGDIHRGLLTLRSSLGSKAGNKGDFYMSYDYFRVLILEAQQITLAPEKEDLFTNGVHHAAIK